ncbi:thiamine-repressible mitochondrial transport protein THI74-like isoform X1 [Aristolochia californica]|uniref:thiamine-repressible mitochondrial transport protein THI74-like isoform X1 n=1 Tax=Aristolochia californica TaxID=171875 RepID=UPI0035D86397
MQTQTWRWLLGVVYILAVATIWIAASYIVQSVVDAGVSPFLITYICNSLFVVCIPMVEIARYWDDSLKNFFIGHKNKNSGLVPSEDSEKVVLLSESSSPAEQDGLNQHVLVDPAQSQCRKDKDKDLGAQSLCSEFCGQPSSLAQQELIIVQKVSNGGLDVKGRWPRTRVAKVSLLICPFWFLAQLTFNLSLKYTTVTSNTILSSASSLFTFLVSLVFLGEKFTWVKLFSVLLCMAGTIIVSLGDSEAGASSVASAPLLGDILALVSAGLYAVYITLIRKKLPDEEKGEGQASMALFLGFLGLFNLLIFLPVALVLNFTKMESFHVMSLKQFYLIVGKGLLDNVLSDYLWAKAVLLTTTTVATAGLTIQVPLAAVVDSVTGHAPHLMDYLGAIAIMAGFVGINIPSDTCSPSSVICEEQEDEIVAIVDSMQNFRKSTGTGTGTGTGT